MNVKCLFMYLQYLERMELLYSGKAREEGVYVVGACGFDSVPSDMGVAFATKKFQGKYIYRRENSSTRWYMCLKVLQQSSISFVFPTCIGQSALVNHLLSMIVSAFVEYCSQF